MYLVLASAIAPILLRIAQVSNARGRMNVADLRGLVADLGASLVVAALVAAIYRALPRRGALPLAGAVLVVWALLNYGNFEHVTALGAVADWGNVQYLVDGTFLKGSALHVSDVMLFGLSLALPLVCFLVYDRTRERPPRPLPSFGCALLLLIAVPLTPTNPEYTAWRQTNFVVETLRRLTARAEPARADHAPIFGIYPGDLDGTPVVSLGRPNTNVLLVILEGIPGAALDTFAARQGITGARPRLPALDAKLSGAMSYVNFVNHQRQTNRGVYALVCGEPAVLATTTPKMTESSLVTEPLFCLPEALRRAGYATAFLQAAPLGFMGKDAWAERAGFTRVHGVEWFAGEPVSAWGPNDRVFLDKSLALIDELSQGEQPWFLTLLTSGTHHPFNVPESFTSEHDQHTFSNAVAFLDTALQRFLAGLEERGVFDDTLVLFTSDESFGLPGDLGNDAVMLSQAWGYLVAFLPSREHALVKQPHMQADVALSVLDYLGMPVEASRFRGRSLFRTYTSARAVPFANTYLRMTGAFDGEGHVLMCDESLASGCRTYAREPARLFTPLGQPTLLSEAPPLLRNLVARSLVLAAAEAPGGDAKTRELFRTPATVDLPAQVLQQRSVERARELRARGDKRSYVATFRIFGDQYLSLAAGERIDFELDVEVAGEASASFYQTFTGVAYRDIPTGEEYLSSIDEQQTLALIGDDPLGVRPMFSAKTQKFFGRTAVVPGGGRLRYRYSFGATEPYQRLQFTLLAGPAGPQDAAIVVHTARVTITKMGDAAKEAGLHVSTLEPAAGIAHRTGYNVRKSINM
ncbi:MAG TPA: LTA synthase family protein [Candidatus Limnocylindria bacterium]|nr:LTA synthase family protein [Candidatus Limnocylindria bacterium]